MTPGDRGSLDDVSLLPSMNEAKIAEAMIPESDCKLWFQLNDSLIRSYVMTSGNHRWHYEDQEIASKVQLT